MEEVGPVSEVETLRTAVIEAAWDACEWGDWHEINYVLPRVLRAAGVEGPFEQHQ